MPLFFLLLLSATSFFSKANATEFPMVPMPVENITTTDKSVLGKILFWDEQLSVDNSVACGTCHRPETGGADPRSARHPGVDGAFNTEDDVFGSPGVVARNALGQLVSDAVFGHQVQITNRTAPSYFMGSWASENFWDGRAGGEFVDSDSGEVLISTGAGLENQAIAPLLSAIEMGIPDRQWQSLFNRLRNIKPLALASDLPQDITAALLQNPTYPQLFEVAFGDSEISLVKLVMAIASYERSLVSNQTPWDFAQKNNTVLPGIENFGWETFKQLNCIECHQPPLFTDNKFHNIGLRNAADDHGRMHISQLSKHRGAMKTPSLRNVGLKNSFMHTGQYSTIAQAFDSYSDVPFIGVADKMANGDNYDFNVTELKRTALLAFLQNSLTDPRLVQGIYPFDRPTLRTEGIVHNNTIPDAPVNLRAEQNENGGVNLQWGLSRGLNAREENDIFDFEIVRDDGQHDWTSARSWEDLTAQAGKEYSYQVTARNIVFIQSPPALVKITTQSHRRIFPLWLLALSLMLLFGVMLLVVKVYQR